MDPIIFVSNHDDWEALYINGIRVAQGHHVTREETVRHIRGCSGQAVQYSVSPEYTADLGELPERFSDIPESELHDRHAFT